MRLAMVRTLAASAVVLALGALTPAGEEPRPEHGKINTADPSPVDPGSFEIEAGYAHVRSRRLWDRDGDSQSRRLLEECSASLAATAGVIENLDVTVAGCYDWLRDNEGDPDAGEHFGDLALGARYRFLNDGGRRLEAAWLGGLTAPAGSRTCRRELGTSQECWSLDQSLVVTKDWGRWTANAEAGYSLPFGEHRDDSRGVLSANLAAGCQVLGWLQPEAEFNYAREILRNAGDPEVLAGTAGLVMPLGEALRVNAGVQQGLWGRNADRATTFLLAIKVAF